MLSWLSCSGYGRKSLKLCQALNWHCWTAGMATKVLGTRSDGFVSVRQKFYEFRLKASGYGPFGTRDLWVWLELLWII